MCIYDILSEHVAKSTTVQETHYLPRHFSRKACEGKKLNSEPTTSVMITGISSECNFPLLPGFCMSLMFVSVASATIDPHEIA